jgi:hypothetical protein
MFGVTMLMDELFKGLGIEPAQARAVFEQIQKEAPDLIARIRTFDERMAEIERINQMIIRASHALLRALAEIERTNQMIIETASLALLRAQDSTHPPKQVPFPVVHPVDTYPAGSARDDSANGAD